MRPRSLLLMKQTPQPYARNVPHFKTVVCLDMILLYLRGFLCLLLAIIFCWDYRHTPSHMSINLLQSISTSVENLMRKKSWNTEEGRFCLQLSFRIFPRLRQFFSPRHSDAQLTTILEQNLALKHSTPSQM